MTMNRIVMHSRIGADGVLQLAVPIGLAEADREVEVTIEPAAPKRDAGGEREEWEQFVHETAGAWQGELEPREPGEKGRTTMTVRWQDYVEERKDVMLGKPVFKGTRLTVEHILRELGTGITFDELLRNYPRLQSEHLQAAMQYALS
jgi:uncharacterized protein (DUF433 family)